MLNVSAICTLDASGGTESVWVLDNHCRLILFQKCLRRMIGKRDRNIGKLDEIMFLLVKRLIQNIFIYFSTDLDRKVCFSYVREWWCWASIFLEIFPSEILNLLSSMTMTMIWEGRL